MSKTRISGFNPVNGSFTSLAGGTKKVTNKQNGSLKEETKAMESVKQESTGLNIDIHKPKYERFGKIEITKTFTDDRVFGRLACAEAQRTITTIGNVLDRCVERNSISFAGANKLMREWILRVNARMSVASITPVKTELGHINEKLVLEAEIGKSFIVERNKWVALNEDEKKEMMRQAKEDPNATGILKCVDAAALTFGQLESLLIGKVAVCVNAGKHFKNGILKDPKKDPNKPSEAGLLRKLSVVGLDDPTEALRIIAQKTFVKWLNDIMNDRGELAQRFSYINDDRYVGFKEWKKRSRSGEVKPVRIFQDVLIQLIGCLRTFKPNSSGTIRCGIYNDKANFIIFGCYQVSKSKTFKTYGVHVLNAEEKEAFKKANTMLDFPDVEEF